MTFEEMRKRYRKEELGYSEQSAVAEEEQDLKERARTGSAFDDYSFRRIQELYITGQLDNPKPAASSSSPKLDYGTKKDLETLDFEKKYDGYSLANLSSAYADTDNKDEQAWIENKIQQSNSREDIQKLVDALHKSGESDAQRMKEGYVYDGYNQTAGERLAHMSARYQNQISMLERVGNRIKRGQSADDADKEAEKKYGGMSVSELMDAYYGSSDNEKQWITSRLQSAATADDYTAKIDELSDKITQAKGEYDKLSDELDHLDGDRYDAVFNRMTQLGRDIEENKKRLGKYQDELKPAKLRDKKNEYMQLRYSADFAENSYSRKKEQERGDWDNRKYMTADEQAVYNYLYNTQGEEQAEDFFKSMESELNKRMTASESQKAADFAEAEPVLSSVVSIGQNLVSGVGAVEDIGRAITGQPVDQNSALHLPSHLATAQRQAVAGNIDNDLGKWVYNTAMSAADSAANILVAKGAGSVAGALGASASAAEKITVYASDVLMGSQVATQTVIQAKDKGLTDSQAVAQGVIHGLIEGVTEHFSVENILADPRNFRQTLLKSFVAEGSEEVAANWLDRIADSIIEGDEYEKRRKYEEYLKQGMSDTEALTNIVIEYLGEDADSFLAGGVSGVAMSAASHGYNGVAYDINQAREKIGNHMANTAVGKAVIQGDNAENEINDLINDGKNLDKGSAGYKLAQKLEEKQGHGKKLSASEIGKLYGYVKESKLKFVTANMSEEEQATVINAAEKLSNGQALSDEEVKAINDSPNAAQAIAILTGAEENETNSLVERQSESTAEYKTSSSGKTEADGKEFTGTLEIKSIDRQTGDVTYNLIDTDGTTEERSVLDLQFDSDETTQLHKKATAFSNINEANAFVDSHEKGQDVDEYTREWDLYSNYGRHSLSLNEQGRMDNGYVLSDEQKMTAYSYGLENYKSVAQRRKIASEALRASASFGYEQGTFNSTVSPKKRLNKEQKNVISALKIVSGAGINVEVFESKADKSGAFIGENGSFDVSTKTLRVDINAGYNTVKESLASAFKYGMLNTAAHELTHVAKHSGSWDELRNAVINVMEMGGEDFAKLTDSKLTQLQKSGKYQDYTSDELDELAEEEAICESCETMLQDGSLFEELVRENPKQANKLLEALKKVLDSVRNFFKRNGKYARTEQGKALLRALDKTESDLQAIWNKAVKEGIQAVNAGVESKGEIKEQARKKQKYEKQGGEWSDALTGAEWAKYNNAITSGVDAGLRISDNSILVECEENNIYQYKFVIYDNTFEDNPITSIYAIGNIDYNVTNANKLAQIIYEMENRGYGQKVFDKGLRRYAKGYKILLGKYNRKSNRYNQYGQSVATVRTNIKNQSNGTATYTTAGQIKFSDRIAQSDTDYLSAVERGDMETAQRMVDEAAKAAGYDLHLYHGSKSGGGFTMFKDWQYFTANQAYAERYTQHDTGKGMYDVYVKASRMFDTRNADDRALFEQYRSEYGMSNLQDSGLPDWTDGYDLSEIIEENDLDYDGIILDEGGDLVDGKPVSRGESYVIRNSSQVKSADPVTYDDEGKVIPLSERFKTDKKDIRYQDRYDEEQALWDNFSLEDDESFFDTFDYEDAEQLIEIDPEDAAAILQTSYENTVNKVIKGYSWCKLREVDYDDILKRLAKGYDIPVGNGFEARDELKQAIERFVDTVEQTDADTELEIKRLATALNDIFDNYISSNRRSSKVDYNSLAAQMAYDAVTAIIDAKAEIAAAYVEQGSAETIAELRRANDNLHKEYLAKMEAEKKKYERSIKKLNKGNDAKVARIQEYWAEFERKLREEKENVLKRNAESSSNRSIIANALPSLAKNEGELKRVDTYRSYVKKLDSLDASIKSITRQIKELRFTKGYDKAKLKELENRKATLEKQLDRKEKALVNGFESTKPIQDLMNRAKRDAVNKAKAAKDKRIRQLREDGKERLRRQHEADMASKQEHLKKVREARDKKLIAAKEKRENDLRTLRDNRDKNVYIGKIKKLAKEFQQMALRPNDKSYVIPEFLRSGFYEAAQLITDAIKLSDNTKVGQGLGKISRMIGELAEDDLYKFEFDADFRKQVDAFAKAIEGKKIDRNLTLREAEDIYRLLKSIKDSIRDANKLLGKEEGHTVHEAGLRVIDDQNSIDRTFFNKHLNGIKNFFMTPERMSNMLNGYNPKAALVELFNDIKSGQRKKNRFFMEANKPFTQYRSEHVQELDDTVHNVREIVWHDNTGGKHTTRMTGMQAMQIVMTWNREAADNNLAHLTKGGITLANPELLAKGKIGKAYEKSFKVYGLNQSFIGEIQKSLTEFERGYIKLAEDLFNKKSTDAINEVSLVLKHREIAKSKYYIPISVDSNEVVKDIDGIKFDASIEGMGMLKSITPKSDKSVLIVGLDNVITKHIDNVSKYYGLAIPIRNLNKVLNVSDTVRDEDGTVETRDTVKSSLQKNWGKLGEGVYTQLLTDLQTSRSAKGGVFEQNANKLIRTIRSNFVTSTLNANKSVVLKQAASYSAAGVYLNHTALVKGLGMFNKDYVGKGRYKKLLDEIDSHTAQHYIRRAGLSSNEISDIQSNWFSHFLSNNAAGRKISSSKLAQKLPKGVNPNNWIQEMDCMTTAALWCACKQQLNAEYHKAGKQLETKAYWQELTDLYDKVIEDTQPMYDPMHRPETLKLSNELIKSVFMFKTQPLQNAGIIYDAVGRLAQNKSDKAARRQLRKAVVSQVESLMTFALMSLAVAFLLHNLRRYKDEDDELTVQSVLGTVFSDIGQNGAGLLLPFGGSELVKGIFGNGDIVSDNVLEPITQLFDSGNELVQTVGKEFENNNLGLGVNSDNILKAIDDFVITAGQGIFGLPVKNVKKNLNSYIEWAKDIADGNGIFDSKMEDKSKKQTAHLYAKAYESGNTSEADRILTDYYNTELEKAKADGKTKNPENKASASTRDMLVGTYKTEYQKAFLKNDADQMRRIEKILYSANKYMKWRSGNNPITLNTGTASEPGKLKKWRMNAKNDIQSKNK